MGQHCMWFVQAHPLFGLLDGHSLFGISSVSLVAHGPIISLEDCNEAATNANAADKFFMNPVMEFNPEASSLYGKELPALTVHID